MNPLIWLFFERPVSKKSYADFEHYFTKSGKEIAQRLSASADSMKNRQQIAHVIGIERWAQRRLRVALGEPLIIDEYDGYAPSADNWSDLRHQFDQCRQETISIIQALGKNSVRLDTTIKHNQFGLVSIRGWLGYMGTHAKWESKRIKTK